jgi:hypothetical protein
VQYMLSIAWNNSSEMWEDIQRVVNEQITQWGYQVCNNVSYLTGRDPKNTTVRYWSDRTICRGNSQCLETCMYAITPLL